MRVPAAFFESSAADAQILLAQLPDASDLNRELLAGGHSVVAGRLAGALRAVGRSGLADDILGTMRSAGYAVQESDPFGKQPPALGSERTRSSHRASKRASSPPPISRATGTGRCTSRTPRTSRHLEKLFAT